MATTKKITLQSQSYYSDAHSTLVKEKDAKTNVFDVPQIDFVSINVGCGKYDSKQKTEIAQYLEALTGQKPKAVQARISVAGFKLRKGDIVGYQVTLRSKKMRDFLLNLVYIALPRTRDFKGTKQTSFDSSYKTYSLGIENTAIFPQIGFDASVNFGMQVNIVFKKPSETNKDLLTKLNFPFKR